MIPTSDRVRYWREERRKGRFLFAAACGSPATAEAVLHLAPDLIVYHPAFDGNPEGPEPDRGGTEMLSALAYAGNANLAASRGVAAMLPKCAPCPVAMGVCGTDHMLLRGPAFASWRGAGLEGIANFPTIGLVDGFIRADLEASGMGIEREVQYLQAAHAEGFFTIGFACAPDQAASMAEAGCDMLIVHLGVTADAEPRPLSSWKKDPLQPYLSASKGKGRIDPLMLLHADHLASPGDESAWKNLAGSGAGCDGLFAVARLAARMQALTLG